MTREQAVEIANADARAEYAKVIRSYRSKYRSVAEQVAESNAYAVWVRRLEALGFPERA